MIFFFLALILWWLDAWLGLIFIIGVPSLAAENSNYVMVAFFLSIAFWWVKELRGGSSNG